MHVYTSIQPKDQTSVVSIKNKVSAAEENLARTGDRYCGTGCHCGRNVLLSTFQYAGMFPMIDINGYVPDIQLVDMKLER
jgi:hypothetical protein